jgi:predicted PurR-regulated permease PerM
MFISYYILIYNKEIFKALNEYIPLSLKKQNTIINSIAKNVKVLFKGYFLTGIIQTIVAFFGYLIFGAPNLLIISFLTLIASLIPYLGTPLVWIPISIYMIIIGNSFGGIGLLIYGTFVINLIDNFLRPILMSDKDTIPPALVFIGFVGGLLAFGMMGIILGPLIIAITSILLKYLKETYELQN